MKKFIILILSAITISFYADENAVNLAEGILDGTGKIKISKAVDSSVNIENKIVKIVMNNENSFVSISSLDGIKIHAGKKYMMTIDMKIDKMQTYNPKDMIYFYIYNTSNKANTWLAVRGNGSSEWFTIMLPFEADKLLKGIEASPVILCNFCKVSGEFELKNINVCEIPADSDMQRGVITPENKTESTRFYTIK